MTSKDSNRDVEAKKSPYLSFAIPGNNNGSIGQFGQTTILIRKVIAFVILVIDIN